MTLFQIIVTEKYSRYVGQGEGWCGSDYEDDYECYPIAEFSSEEDATKAINHLKALGRKADEMFCCMHGTIVSYRLAITQVFDSFEKFEKSIAEKTI